MKKKYIIALLLVFVVGGAVFAKIFPSFVSRSPESALPLISEDSEYFLLKAENPALLQKGISFLLGFKRAFDKNEEAEEAINIIEQLAGRLEIVNKMALLALPGDTSRFYMSFYPEGEKFARFISDGGQRPFKITEWQTSKGEGWRLGLLFSELQGSGGPSELYMLKTSSMGQDIVLIAESEESIDKMIEAQSSQSSRIKIKRYNPGPDYIQMRRDAGLPDGEGAKLATTELAVAADSKSAHLQIYTDLYSRAANGAVPKSGVKGSDLPMLGSGDLAAVFACDIPYACFTVMPLAKDPIAEAVEYASPLLGAQYEGDIKNIMKSGRLSMVVTGSVADNPSTAYLVVESKAKAELDRLFTMISGLLKPAELKGWDAASFVGSDVTGTNFGALAARRKDILLLGIGSLADFSKEASIPESMKSFAAPHDLINFAATSSLWSLIGGSVSGALGDTLDGYGVDLSALSGIGIKGAGAVELRVITPGKADWGVYWGK